MGIAQEALLVRFEDGHKVLDYTISDLNGEQLHHIADGGTIGSPASIYFHVIWVEDLVVNQMLQGTDSIYDAGSWSDRLPTVAPHRGPSSLEWAKGITFEDRNAVADYASAVRANTRSYVESLSDDELAREVEFFTGATKQVNVLSWLNWNLASHTGEIAAMRGLAGSKGLPF